jgi:8-oxo-dGTP pyrophosphatase MutT (NUDIX family)
MKSEEILPIPEYVLKLRAKIGHEMLYMPGAVAVICNEAGEVLLQRRSDNGRWSLVSGILEPGEEPAIAIAREAQEEAGIKVIPERIVGIYSHSEQPVRYPNGDEMMFLTLVFACRPVAGEPRVNDEESLEVRYFARDALPEMDLRHRYYLEQALRNLPQTDFIWSE